VLSYFIVQRWKMRLSARFMRVTERLFAKKALEEGPRLLADALRNLLQRTVVQTLRRPAVY